jgi:hypothetical protein
MNQDISFFSMVERMKIKNNGFGGFLTLFRYTAILLCTAP